MEGFQLDTIYNMDCLEGMKMIPDNSIDLVATDCPYKIMSGGCTKSVPDYAECGEILTHRKTVKRTDWVDDVRTGKMFADNDIQFSEWLPEIYRVLKEQAHCYIMVNSRNLKDLQTEAEKVGFQFHNLLIWDKGNATPNRWYMQAHECILFLRKGRAFNINNLGTSTLLRVPNIHGGKLHPTEKPVDLMRIMIENSTQEGGIVLDTFMGSAPTAVACIRTHRHYIGFELNKEYYDKANERIKNELAQLEMRYSEFENHSMGKHHGEN